MERQECYTCKYFRRGKHWCLRYPPTLQPLKASGENRIRLAPGWPSVRPEDWCGEWAAIPKAPKLVGER